MFKKLQFFSLSIWYAPLWIRCWLKRFVDAFYDYLHFTKHLKSVFVTINCILPQGFFNHSYLFAFKYKQSNVRFYSPLKVEVLLIWVVNQINVEPAALHHEMHVAFSACYDNIHPDTHGFGRRSHHVVHSIVGLHTEGQRRIGALCEWEGKVMFER